MITRLTWAVLQQPHLGLVAVQIRLTWAVPLQLLPGLGGDEVDVFAGRQLPHELTWTAECQFPCELALVVVRLKWKAEHELPLNWPWR